MENYLENGQFNKWPGKGVPLKMQNEQYRVIKPDELVLRDYLAAERTVLSNERTFLAYLRTALAFAGGGVSLIFFLASMIADVTGILLIISGVATLAIGVWRYFKTRRSLDILEKMYQKIRLG